MTLNETLGIAGGFITVISAIFAVFLKVVAIASQQGANTLKLDTLWKAFEQMALAESINKGFMKMNSPVTSTKRSIEAFTEADLRHELQEFYQTEGYKLNEVELQSEIQKRFGERLLKEIALPYNLHSGGHIIAAIKIAKGEDF